MWRVACIWCVIIAFEYSYSRWQRQAADFNIQTSSFLVGISVNHSSFFGHMKGDMWGLFGRIPHFLFRIKYLTFQQVVTYDVSSNKYFSVQVFWACNMRCSCFGIEWVHGKPPLNFRWFNVVARCWRKDWFVQNIWPKF